MITVFDTIQDYTQQHPLSVVAAITVIVPGVYLLSTESHTIALNIVPPSTTVSAASIVNRISPIRCLQDSFGSFNIPHNTSK